MSIDEYALFDPFSWGALLRGASIYSFREFYAAKNQLLRYDDRTGYLNYGLWEEGEATSNPSARLVAALADGLPRGAYDLLDVGSGLGQPSIDLLAHTGARRVIGVNRDARQVQIANARLAREGLSDRIQHIAADAAEIGSLGSERFGGAVSVEALAEMPDLDRVLSGIYRALKPESPLVFCDITVPALSRSRTGRVAARVARAMFGDTWRTEAQLTESLSRAGFCDIEVTSIGARVFPQTWAHARAQIGALRGSRVFTAALLAALNLGALARLHALGEVDYVIVRARHSPTRG